MMLGTREQGHTRPAVWPRYVPFQKHRIRGRAQGTVMCSYLGLSFTSNHSISME